MLSCPSCGEQRAQVFHVIDSTPTASNVLLRDRESAVAYPMGEIELCLCGRCGFVFNNRFEPHAVDYRLPYEESQAFSPTFRAFQDAMIERLTITYDLKGKEIFEIGCGKGAFLESLCRHADAVGLGIDPAFDDSRVTDPHVTVVNEFFDQSHTHMTGDLICCRHTLEHVQPVAAFVELMRQSAARRPGSVVLCEVPDTTRILAEGAFWDVFYEHCSYFTPVSLSWLFRSRGFSVLRLAQEFDDQYLVLDAAPAAADQTIDNAAVESLSGLAEVFAGRAADEIQKWEGRLAGTTAVLWGAGSKAVAFLAAVVEGPVAAVIDINPHKQGSFLPGSAKPVLGPERLPDLNPDLVIVMNPIYEPEITETIAELGVRAEVASLGHTVTQV
jgi:hypothetical protein